MPKWEPDLPVGGTPRRPSRPSGADGVTEAVFFAACIGSMFGPAGDGLGSRDALLALAERSGVGISVPDGIGVTLEEAQAQIRAARMVDAAKEFADALGDAGLTDLRHIAFAEDDHVSAAPAAILHGMRFALGRDR